MTDEVKPQQPLAGATLSTGNQPGGLNVFQTCWTLVQSREALLIDFYRQMAEQAGEPWHDRPHTLVDARRRVAQLLAQKYEYDEAAQAESLHAGEARLVLRSRFIGAWMAAWILFLPVIFTVLVVAAETQREDATLVAILVTGVVLLPIASVIGLLILLVQLLFLGCLAKLLGKRLDMPVIVTIRWGRDHPRGSTRGEG